MSRADRSLPRLASLLSACLLLAGCAAGREAARPEGGGVGIRLPVAESFEFSRKTETRHPPAPPPFFEDDEYRYTGRWLTLFEVEFSPEMSPAPAPAPVKGH